MNVSIEIQVVVQIPLIAWIFADESADVGVVVSGAIVRWTVVEAECDGAGNRVVSVTSCMKLALNPDPYKPKGPAP